MIKCIARTDFIKKKKKILIGSDGSCMYPKLGNAIEKLVLKISLNKDFLRLLECTIFPNFDHWYTTKSNGGIEQK